MSALFKMPLVWACLLIVALGGALKIRGAQLETEREARATCDLSLEGEKAEHGRARGELRRALVANVNYGMAEERRREEAQAFAAEQARIQAELRGLLAVSRRERDDADRTFKAFVAQFDAAPESCHIATRQMEAACAALSDY
jgi:hypothetical protein